MVPTLVPVKRLIASFLGSGLVMSRLRRSDAGSGTLGAGLALALSLALHGVGLWAQAAGLVLILAAAAWSVPPFALDKGDPGWVVIDEAAGTMVATMGVGGWAAVAGFAVFRVADIFKGFFPGVAAADKRKGAVGIIGDDIVAGCYGLAFACLVQALLGGNA